MKNLDEKFVAYWEKKRGKGKRFFCITSSLWISIPLALLPELWHSYSARDLVELDFNLVKVIISFVFLFPLNYWKANEKRYLLLKS